MRISVVVADNARAERLPIGHVPVPETARVDHVPVPETAEVGQNPQVELIQARLSDDVVRPILAGMVDEYRVRFGESHAAAIRDIENFSPPAEDFDPPGGTFLVLIEEGRTLSGGGYRNVSSDTCEVKRMWTVPSHRGRGLGSSILSALESSARRQGYRRIILETAPVQIEALSLYRGRGYREIRTYGTYEVATALERILADNDDNG